MSSKNEHILCILCKDQKGIVSWVTSLLAKQGGNILDLEQHSEEESGLFAMRLHVEDISSMKTLEQELKRKTPFQDFRFWIHSTLQKQRMAILVSTESLCLYDLLIKQTAGELPCSIPLIVSHRENLKPIADHFSIPFHYLPIDPKNPQQQEKKLDALLKKNQIDLIVLSRYMRILSKDFVISRLGKMINIHHGFLPAFKGAKPYHQAWERGVKIIGATAHYVVEELDEGPIIHQATVEVTHRHSIQEMIRTGQDLERKVLTQAVRAHLEHRILLVGKRTWVFHF